MQILPCVSHVKTVWDLAIPNLLWSSNYFIFELSSLIRLLSFLACHISTHVRSTFELVIVSIFFVIDFAVLNSFNSQLLTHGIYSMYSIWCHWCFYEINRDSMIGALLWNVTNWQCSTMMRGFPSFACFTIPTPGLNLPTQSSSSELFTQLTATRLEKEMTSRRDVVMPLV